MYQISNHFLEIRLRSFYILFSLIVTLSTSYYYQIEIFYIIGRPFLELDQKFILIDLTEAFYTILKICGIISIFMILPFFIYHFWSFYIPSRYNFERTILKKYVILFVFLFFFELVLLYFVVFPKICEFFLSFEIISTNSQIQQNILQYDKELDPTFLWNKKEELPSFLNKEEKDFISVSKKLPVLLELTARLESYVKFSSRFYFIMSTLFQIPFLIHLFYYYNILDCYLLSKIRKFFLFSSLLISAFISPPDIISQSILAILLFFFYELLVFLGIFYSNRVLVKKKKK